MLSVYTKTAENCLVNGSDDGLMPLGGQYLGRPERRLVHPFGAIGTGRPIYFNIPDPEPTFALTDLTFPSFVWDADRKREFDIELLREMLTSALGTSRVASRPKVPTRSYCICQWCSDEVFNDDGSDSSSEILPSPSSRESQSLTETSIRAHNH